MSGSYAHITFANLASEKRGLIDIKGFPREAIDAANLHINFLELGCISPDYPYMDITSGDSKEWADAMHYTHSCNVIYTGAELIRNLTSGIEKDKCLAWFMGYTAHVVTDMCIHPVVELKVGSYKGNETPHRRCEMHQDVYIFRRMGTSMPQISDHLNSTVLTCSEQNDPTRLDKDVKGLWEGILQTVHKSQFENDPPDIDKWHKRCYGILQKLLPTTSRFVGFARHVCDGLGFSYPTSDEVDQAEYIQNLMVPGDRRMHYDDIFDFTIEHIRKVWLDAVSFALGQEDRLTFRNDEWNLDTGKDALDDSNKLIFWEVA
ncbi:MAG: zinc dependent phospholipase C family protein [Deltaproteobacteria bacterium]